ncbi:MAG: DUF3717 domain-containing protein [Gammaproteobacteria bacterium]|nr:DUF3717 domain-containing protein [Gammaproteobacteria bacterium]
MNKIEKIDIGDLEEAINYWRNAQPSGTDASLAVELAGLATLYADLIRQHRHWFMIEELSQSALYAWQVWQSKHPDSPCIGVCSLLQGDVECRGCGRTLQEVTDWVELSFSEKKQIWRRITKEGRAQRFNLEKNQMPTYIPLKSY